jgi:FAD/FMN-containing dehydrogenase
MMLMGWGRFPHRECSLARPRSEEDLRNLVARGSFIARGNGRAYGDSAFSRTNTADMRAFNRMLAFDADTGRLTAEAGVLLSDVISVFLPRGWFPAVMPGTKFVTLGGMAAADVHGKNQHKDRSFGAFIDWLDVMGPDGVVRRCSASDNADLFHWTIGGMGLTGVILRLSFRLRRVETAWIRQTTIPAASLEAAIDAFEAHQSATYSVAWIDCLATGAKLGRSLVMLGEHAVCSELSGARRARPLETPPRRRHSIPIDMPSALLNGISVRAFNAFYYWNRRRKPAVQLIDWDGYFCPLDAILDWNRLYGRSGLAQFQCVLPLDRAGAGLQALLRVTSDAGVGSFLAVLKRFGEQQSRFSFPMLGYTLAMDFPVNRQTLAVMDRLDAVTLDHGGRFYLAKDSRLKAATLAASDPRVAAFKAMRHDTGSAIAFASVQSQRLAL